MNDKKNYNFMALQGIEISDEDYVDEYGVPPEYAYTPELNYWLIDKVYNENVEYLQNEENMTLSQAQAEAGKIRDAKKAEVKELMAQKGLL